MAAEQAIDERSKELSEWESALRARESALRLNAANSSPRDVQVRSNSFGDRAVEKHAAIAPPSPGGMERSGRSPSPSKHHHPDPDHHHQRRQRGDDGYPAASSPSRLHGNNHLLALSPTSHQRGRIIPSDGIHHVRRRVIGITVSPVGAKENSILLFS